MRLATLADVTAPGMLGLYAIQQEVLALSRAAQPVRVVVTVPRSIRLMGREHVTKPQRRGHAG